MTMITVSASGASGSRSKTSSFLASYLVPVLVFVVFVAALSLVNDRYLARLTALVIFWGALATTWNWIGGYAGQLSLGHAAFVGLGAYFGYALETQFGIPPWFALAGALPLGALAAVAIGAPTLRLTGVFFSLATVAFPLALQIVFIFLGYQEVLIKARPDNPGLYMQWSDPRAYAILFGAIFLIYWLATTALERSQWHYYLAAIRQDQIGAAAVGINTFSVKLVTFTISGAAACVLGVVYAQMLFVITPDTVFGVNVSLQAMVLCLVGGIGRRYGPLLGTLLVVPMTQTLEAHYQSVPGVAQLFYGIVLIAVILVIPNGVIAWLLDLPWLARFRTSRATSSKTAPAVDDPFQRRNQDVPALVPSTRTKGNKVALTIDKVSKSYYGVIAVNKVSFSVRNGEFLGIVGPNGAGKTTLFDLLTGFQTPTEGEIRLGSRNSAGLPAYRFSRDGLRRTFQVPRPFPTLSVYENVLLGALPVQNRLHDSIETSVWSALKAIGLSKLANSQAGLLTPSQIRLVEVARALAGNPDILLLDEPLAGLDSAESRELIEILSNLNAAGLTIVMVDHAIATVANVVERMIVLDNGHLIADGEPADVTRAPRVVEAYLGTRWQDA